MLADHWMDAAPRGLPAEHIEYYLLPPPYARARGWACFRHPLSIRVILSLQLKSLKAIIQAIGSLDANEMPSFHEEVGTVGCRLGWVRKEGQDQSGLG